MKKISTINGLRGLAIIGVVYHHLLWSVTKPGWHSIDIAGLKLFPYTALSNSWAGVNLFFILSGFVLFLPYAEKRRELKSTGDAIAFYIHRGKRLLPLYYLSIIISIFFFHDVLHHDRTVVRNLLLMFTATFNFTVDMWFPKYNGLLWSIGIEIWFCLLFPFLIIASRRIGLLRLFIIVCAISLATRYAGVYYDSYFNVNGTYHNALKDSLPGRVDDFMLGMVAAWLYVNRYKDNPVRRPFLYLIAGLVALGIGGSIWDYNLIGMLSKYFIPITNNLFQAGFLLVIISLLSISEGPVHFLVNNRPLQVLGMMCYSVYIWHQQTIFAIMRGDAHYTAVSLLMFFAVLLALSAITYRYVEFGHKSIYEIFLLKNPSGKR